jgi:hypothetical protein
MDDMIASTEVALGREIGKWGNAMNAQLSKASFVLLVTALLGAPLASGATNNPDVKFDLKFPAEVAINLQPPVQNNGQTAVSAGLTLTNTSKSDVTLTASSECRSHTWEVTDDATHKVVDHSMLCPVPSVPADLKIEAGKSSSMNRDVVLVGTRYSNGGKYTLSYHYWGYTQTAKFTTKISQ